MLEGLPLRFFDLRELQPIDAPSENGDTFLDNAVLKARYYAEHAGMMAMADDSGIEVDALDGKPGVRSARFGGEHLTDTQRTDLLLRELSDVSETDRTARFKCVVAVAGIDSVEGCVTAEGAVEGTIIFAPRGNNGFGYDPIFIPDGETRTTAEMSGDEKDRISHRGRAIRSLKPRLLDLLGT